MLLTFVFFASVALSKSCARPRGWCSHTNQKFEWKDCDGDGIKDPVCSDDQGRYGWIPSAENCKSNWNKVKSHQCQANPRPSKCGKFSERETEIDWQTFRFKNWKCEGGYPDLRANGPSSLEKCLELCSDHSRKKGVKGCCSLVWQRSRGPTLCEFYVGGKATQTWHTFSKKEQQVSMCDGTSNDRWDRSSSSTCERCAAYAFYAGLATTGQACGNCVCGKTGVRICGCAHCTNPPRPFSRRMEIEDRLEGLSEQLALDIGTGLK